MPTRTEVIQQIRSKDEVRLDDVALILDYYDSNIGSTDAGARTTILNNWRAFDFYHENDLAALRGYITTLGGVTRSSSDRAFFDTMHLNRQVVTREHILQILDEALLPPAFLLEGADIVFRADVLSSLWLDTSRTMPALGTLDEEIHAWDNLGTDTGLIGVQELQAGDHALYVPSGLNGLPALRSDGTNTTLEGGAAKSGTFTSAYQSAVGGLSMFAIGANFTDGGNTVLELTDGGPDTLGWADTSGFRSLRNAVTEQIFTYTPNVDGYFFVNMPDDGTISAKDFSGSADVGTIETANQVDISTAFGEVRMFGNVSGTTGPCQLSEAYYLNRESTDAEIAEWLAYCSSKFGLTKAT